MLFGKGNGARGGEGKRKKKRSRDTILTRGRKGNRASRGSQNGKCKKAGKKILHTRAEKSSG